MGDIETRLLRYFVALAEERHFAHAAQRLKISPPTLTHQIKKLESELGTRLLERNGNTNIEITEAGIRFLARARDVLRQIEEAKIVAQQAARGEMGRIEIGFMPAASCAGQMQIWLRAFQQANPAIEINLHRMVPQEQITAIIRKDLDVGFTRGPDKYPAGLEGFDVYRQPMVLALPSKHPLARRKTIDPAVLKDEMFFNTAPNLDVGFWGHTEAVAKVGHFSPRVAKRIEDMFTILTYVSIGYGIAVISKSMSKINMPNVVYRELAGSPVPTSSIAFVYRRNDLSPAANQLTKFMRRHAMQHQTDDQDGAHTHS
jgi:DNA-binding transcriptional LysR family regulator